MSAVLLHLGESTMHSVSSSSHHTMQHMCSLPGHAICCCMSV